MAICCSLIMRQIWGPNYHRILCIFGEKGVHFPRMVKAVKEGHTAIEVELKTPDLKGLIDPDEIESVMINISLLCEEDIRLF